MLLWCRSGGHHLSLCDPLQVGDAVSRACRVWAFSVLVWTSLSLLPALSCSRILELVGLLWSGELTSFPGRWPYRHVWCVLCPRGQTGQVWAQYSRCGGSSGRVLPEAHIWTSVLIFSSVCLLILSPPESWTSLSTLGAAGEKWGSPAAPTQLGKPALPVLPPTVGEAAAR